MSADKITLSRTKPVITVAAAEELIRRGIAHAEKIGKTVALAVVDDAGFLLAFKRMDAANPAAAQIAIDKAYTAAVSHIATHKWQEIMQNDEPLRVITSYSIHYTKLYDTAMHWGAIIVAPGFTSNA